MIVKEVFGTTSQSTTDGVVVAAVAGRRIRVLALELAAAATVTAATFNSKPAGAGTAISPAYAAPVNTGAPLVLPTNPSGYFDTNVGEGLSLTTGAGSTVSWRLTYGLCYSL